MSPNLMVVEDNPLMRITLTSTLESLGFAGVASAESARTAMAQAKAHPPDVAILDLNLGVGPTGIDLAVSLRQLLPALGIVMLTSYADPRCLPADIERIPLGSQFLVKQSITDVQMIVDAISRSRSAAHRFLLPEIAGEASLTVAQVELLRMIADGLSNREIARQRGITERGVENAVTRLTMRLGVRSEPRINVRVQLVRRYEELMGLHAG